MLNKEKHQLVMGQILKDIYSDISISSFLGLKGGTCAYLFYGLPRFSVDLDFDLLSGDEKTKQIVFEKIGEILNRHGKIKDKFIKRYTLFFLLSYGEQDHNIKIEISSREISENMRGYYEVKDYLGISLLVAKKEYLFAGKLAAFTLRSETATRDLYDIHYFFKENWDVDKAVIKKLVGKNLKEHLLECLKKAEKIKNNQILSGLGELLGEKQKQWAKKNLKKDVLFLLKLKLTL